MVRNRITYICALLGCFGFYIAYREWLSWLLLVGLLWLPWLSLAVSLPLLWTFRAGVSGPVFLETGAEGVVTLQGSARYLVPPLGGRLRLQRCNTGEVWLYKNGGAVPADHCGGIRVTPEKVYVCDLLGLFRFPVRKTDSLTVLVRPRALQMPQPPELERYLARAWRPKPGGGYAENHEMRLYRPGDSLNQIHWKLTAKTGKLTIREPMEPQRGLVLLTLDIKGTARELDRKFGQLLWLGGCLIENRVPFQIRALTGDGIFSAPVESPEDLKKAVDALLCAPGAGEGSILDREQGASWHRHLGGEPDEA